MPAPDSPGVEPSSVLPLTSTDCSPCDGGLQATSTASVDDRLREVERNIDRHGVVIEHLATREDIERAKNSILRWFVAVVLGMTVAMAGLLNVLQP